MMSWSRFDTLTEQNRAVPVYVLQNPLIKEGVLVQRGVLLCGHKVVGNLVDRHGNDFSKCWFVISDSQSGEYGTHPAADLQMFSDPSLVKSYKNSPCGDTPFIQLGDGHFVDPTKFFPEPDIEKEYDAIYVAKWFPTKRLELFVEAFEYLTDINALLLGFHVLAKKNRQKGKKYARRIKDLIKKKEVNIDVVEAPDKEHVNNDGSFVPGGFTKEKIRKFINSAKVSILTADINEAINRTICESLCCDLPAVITKDTEGGVTELVNTKTGVLVSPQPHNIARGIKRVLNTYNSFEPRKFFTKRFGAENAIELIKDRIKLVTEKRGEALCLDDFEYYGDLWTKDYYSFVAPLDYDSIKT